MPRYSKPWVGPVISCVKQYRYMKNRKNGREAEVVKAIDKAIEETRQIPDTGSLRVQAAMMMYINQTHRTTGIARELNYSNRNIEKWNRQFIALCAKNMGYKY